MKLFTLISILSMIVIALVSTSTQAGEKVVAVPRPLLTAGRTTASLAIPFEPILAERATCLSCPAARTAGDSRCTYLNPSDNTTDSATGCVSCGCQKCPDGKIYSNNVRNYCKASPNSNCRSGVACTLQACGFDQRCDGIPFDRDIAPCGCPCQTCPGGGVYGQTFDYLISTPLSVADQAKTCPKAVQPVRNLCT